MPTENDYFDLAHSVRFSGRAQGFVGNTLGHAWVAALPGPNGCLIVSDDYKVDENPNTDTFFEIKDISAGGFTAAQMYLAGKFYNTLRHFKILITVGRDVVQGHNN